MATLKRTYGRKAKPLLQQDFFDSAPTPEIRRSPRLRKVLQERSHNVQTLSHTPTLSPTKRAPHSGVVQELVGIDLTPNHDEDTGKRQASSKRTQDSEATEGLANALNSLAISTPESTLHAHLSTPEIPRSITRRPASTSSPHSRTQKLRHHSAPLSRDTISYLDPLIACKNVSKTVESFDGWVEERVGLLAFTKIGEGSYGQVFRATDARGETVIIKLMPLNSPKAKKWQCFTSIDSASTEVQLLEKMQKVPGYVEFRGACILQGRMPNHFINLWQDYKDSGRTIESRDPRGKSSYPPTQLWLMLELSDAGTNLEPGRYLPPEVKTIPKNGKYLSVLRVWDIFWQVTHAIAKAELYCDFEHRDLHLGNICVKDVTEGQQPVPLHFPFPVDSSGTLVTIIDYTLSRANVSPGLTLAFDFQSDEALLSGDGDLQYDIYRWMDEVLGDRGYLIYDPRTNVLWLYHLLRKLRAVTAAVPRGKGTHCGKSMKKILGDVEDLISPDNIAEWVANSAGDLLQCAYAKDWIKGA